MRYCILIKKPPNIYAQQDATISCPTVDSGNKFAHTLKAYPAEVSYSKQEHFYTRSL